MRGIRTIWRIVRGPLQDLFFIVVLGVAFYVLYNTTIPGLGKSVRSFVAYGTSEVLTLLAAIAVALYAYKTVYEMTKDRRKDTVERMLENVYSPLYEILRKAKFENDERSKARSLPGFEWSLKDDELDRIRNTVERFGHYFDRDEIAKFSKLLENPKRTRVNVFWFNGFSEVEMSRCFKYIMKQRQDLTEELRQLTKPP